MYHGDNETSKNAIYLYNLAKTEHDINYEDYFKSDNNLDIDPDIQDLDNLLSLQHDEDYDSTSHPHPQFYYDPWTNWHSDNLFIKDDDKHQYEGTPYKNPYLDEYLVNSFWYQNPSEISHRVHIKEFVKRWIDILLSFHYDFCENTSLGKAKEKDKDKVKDKEEHQYKHKVEEKEEKKEENPETEKKHDIDEETADSRTNKLIEYITLKYLKYPIRRLKSIDLSSLDRLDLEFYNHEARKIMIEYICWYRSCNCTRYTNILNQSTTDYKTKCWYEGRTDCRNIYLFIDWLRNNVMEKLEKFVESEKEK